MAARRSRKDAAGEFLEAVIKSPNTAPSRLFAAAGINYRFLRTLAENDLISI